MDTTLTGQLLRAVNGFRGGTLPLLVTLAAVLGRVAERRGVPLPFLLTLVSTGYAVSSTVGEEELHVRGAA